ncbi:hypothetical protein PROFUN_10300 [Planoprotostelium fungivorum]|uniref:Uncharacterized protein n=1 Tax=Planoprotostelium fungivorum TaxID=1890364 RepID=A0A2P6MRS3_9EUKA|nr:hypothetical protein PROFUN_10300 [Planoprotostelium fungivorum]
MAPQIVNQRDPGDFIQPPATQQNITELQNLFDEGQVVGEEDAERTCPLAGSIKVYGLEQIPPVASTLDAIAQQSRI